VAAPIDRVPHARGITGPGESLGRLEATSFLRESDAPGAKVGTFTKKFANLGRTHTIACHQEPCSEIVPNSRQGG